MRLRRLDQFEEKDMERRLQRKRVGAMEQGQKAEDGGRHQRMRENRREGEKGDHERKRYLMDFFSKMCMLSTKVSRLFRPGSHNFFT